MLRPKLRLLPIERDFASFAGRAGVEEGACLDRPSLGIERKSPACGTRPCIASDLGEDGDVRQSSTGLARCMYPIVDTQTVTCLDNDPDDLNCTIVRYRTDNAGSASSHRLLHNCTLLWVEDDVILESGVIAYGWPLCREKEGQARGMGYSYFGGRVVPNGLGSKSSPCTSDLSSKNKTVARAQMITTQTLAFQVSDYNDRSLTHGRKLLNPIMSYVLVVVQPTMSDMTAKERKDVDWVDEPFEATLDARALYSWEKGESMSVE
ncbi:hypothetical protein G7046_g3946 [Stylonectria norvegica]|nr:hypothetical protein G7046_g3946 [Stylonectria norvegica]